jgi:hypothetical protein
MNLIYKWNDTIPKSKFHKTNHIWRQEENRRIRVRLGILGKGHLLGIKEVLDSMRSCNSRAIVHSLNATIYEISKNDFLELSPWKSNEKLKEIVEIYDKWHEGLIKNQNKLSKELCPSLTKTLYQTKENFSDSRRMIKHIQKK